MPNGNVVMDTMQRTEILDILTETDPVRLEDLFQRSDKVRRQNVGDGVHLRGLIELSNHCRRQCIYCGLRGGNATLARYRMTADEVLRLYRSGRVAGVRNGCASGGRRP